MFHMSFIARVTNSIYPDGYTYTLVDKAVSHVAKWYAICFTLLIPESFTSSRAETGITAVLTEVKWNICNPFVKLWLSANAICFCFAFS